jgi:hypothetical protein
MNRAAAAFLWKKDLIKIDLANAPSETALERQTEVLDQMILAMQHYTTSAGITGHYRCRSVLRA